MVALPHDVAILVAPLTPIFTALWTRVVTKLSCGAVLALEENALGDGVIDALDLEVVRGAVGEAGRGIRRSGNATERLQTGREAAVGRDLKRIRTSCARPGRPRGRDLRVARNEG